MSEEKEYYKDRNMSITYIPTKDIYHISIESTKGFEKRMSLDQRILEEFSRNDIAHLSDSLAMMGLSIGLNRTDVMRLHHGIESTMKKYDKEVEEFKKKESL